MRGYKGYSASTIGSDALMINHILIGSGHWKIKDRLIKSELPKMPQRSNKIVHQRQKPLTSSEWIKRYPHEYARYKVQIDTIRAFGLRRRELTGGTSQDGRDGLGSRSIYNQNGQLWAITIGKGGKIRWVRCRADMSKEMKQLFADEIRPWSARPRNEKDFKHNLKYNHPFFKSFDHNIPTHIHRAAYAQHMIRELSHYHYSGSVKEVYYHHSGCKPNGKWKYSKKYKEVNSNKSYQIGIYKAPIGAFYKLAQYMGHNRRDVLRAYLGEGR